MGQRSARRCGGRRKAAAPPRLTSWLKITLREGRKRQIRRMVALLGHPAVRVIRIGLGPLQLGELRRGKWRDLHAGRAEGLARGGPARRNFRDGGS